MMEEWVATHGTPDQRERFAAGALPKAEWLAAVADATFAPLGADADVRLQRRAHACRTFLRQLPAYASVVVTYADYRVVTQAADDGHPGAVGVDAVGPPASADRQRPSPRARTGLERRLPRAAASHDHAAR